MAQFLLDPNDLNTEATFLRYKEGQRRVRSRAAQHYQSGVALLEEWGDFNDSLAEGGENESIATYNAEYAAQMAGAEAQLQAAVQATLAIILAMQAAVAPLELFPSVPLPTPNDV